MGDETKALDVLVQMANEMDDDFVISLPDDIMRGSTFKELVSAVAAGESALTKRVIEAEALKRASGDQALVVRARMVDEGDFRTIGEPFEMPERMIPSEIQAIEVPPGGLLHVKVGATATQLGTEAPWIPEPDDCTDMERMVRRALNLSDPEYCERFGIAIDPAEPKVLATHFGVDIIPIAMPQPEE